jgi:hypothetical protein
MEKRTRETLYQAADQFNRAIAKDPNYAQAYAGLADAYVLLADRSIISSSEAAPKIRSAAQRALEIDPKLSEAHATMAVLKEGDWERSGTFG